MPEDLEMRLAALYMRRRASADPAFDAQRFAAAYAAMGAQRATKILGLFARLDKRDHKPEYLRHLPRIERYLAATSPIRCFSRWRSGIRTTCRGRSAHRRSIPTLNPDR